MTLGLLASAALRMLLVGTAAWLVMRLFRVRNSHVETLVWRMTLLASLLLPVLLYWQLAPHFTTSLPLPVVAADGSYATGPGSPGSVGTGAPMAVALSIYLGGALLLLMRFAAGLAGMWRVSRAARPMPTDDDVRVSERVASPATFGGIVLLPADAPDWPAEKLEAVLLHERMHVRGGDAYWSWLARLHTAVFWFSPFAWWLQRRLDTLAETTSDDAVVAAHHDPVAYAALLLEFARQPNSRSVVMSVAESNVAKRIERLLARVPPATALPRSARWAALVLLIPGAVLAASTLGGASGLASPTESASAAASEEQARPRLSAGVRMKSTVDPDRYYPEAARQAGVSASVIVEVDVDVLGTVIDARVLEVRPPDARYGFADAALQVARHSTFQNSTQQVASMKFMVKFVPKTGAAPAAAAGVPGSASGALRLKAAADPDHYYPVAAKQEKMTGSVVVEVDVDASGELLDARAVEVQPADPRYGFAEAALQVARNSSYVNTTQQAARMKFMVKFALAE
jgi:TonB family protein